MHGLNSVHLRIERLVDKPPLAGQVFRRLMAFGRSKAVHFPRREVALLLAGKSLFADVLRTSFVLVEKYVVQYDQVL